MVPIGNDTQEVVDEPAAGPTLDSVDAIDEQTAAARNAEFR